MAPDERDAEYLGYWRDGVGRWYGQQMHVEQLRRIKMYWSVTPKEDLPVWAKALDWFIDGGGPTEYPDLPWDFGLWSDYEAMRMMRKYSRRPFQWAVRSERSRYGRFAGAPHSSSCTLRGGVVAEYYCGRGVAEHPSTRG